MQKKCQIDNWLARNARNANQIVACYLASNNLILGIHHSTKNGLRRRANKAMLSSLPDELLQVLSAELDAAAACRLSQVNKAMQHWFLHHAPDRLYAWRHAHAWLMLCEVAKVRVLQIRAGCRSRSVVWNHFTVRGAAANYVRCCCTEGIANGNACGLQFRVGRRSTAALWNHLNYAHRTLYEELRRSAAS